MFNNILGFYERLKTIPDGYYPVVLEEVSCGRIIGTGTLIVEQKFIHHTALVRIVSGSFTEKLALYYCTCTPTR